MHNEHTFRNVPLKDFSVQANRDAIETGLALVESDIRARKLSAAPIINGIPEAKGETFDCFDPSARQTYLGSVIFATPAQAQRALEVCDGGFHGWKSRPFSERAAIIRRIGNIMKERSDYLTGLIIRESGKPWRDADADTAEAIDFCFYYADEMLRLGRPHLTEKVLGEDNLYLYQPRGVVTVIAPWNFPLAIACGMTVAALVTGNCTILKPAEQTSLIAHEFAKIVLEAGVPHDAFAFLPGRGEEVGALLIESPLTSMIVFTGSRSVGLQIISSASVIRPHQRGIKRVVAELGGKNAIIVDDDADFDDAIRGVLQSAFGYAGQKCSACSRLIVVGDAYEPFLTRLAAATSDLLVGPSSNPSSFLGPVIDQEAFNRIMNTISGAADLRLLVQGPISESIHGTGWYIPPTIFRDVPTSHPVWREEIFGPVIACAQAPSFRDALAMANDCDYALTGGVYSRNPENIAFARKEFEVGNLYINRGITGALVCRQPFGGFRFSGVGSKAGGMDYLVQFMEPRTITENTMRRGFTPDLQS